MNMLESKSLTCTPWISFSCTIVLQLFNGSLKPLLRSCAFAILLTMTTHTLCICRRCCLEKWWVGLSPTSLLTCSWKYKLVMIVTCLICILSYGGICIFNCNFQHKVLKLISCTVCVMFIMLELLALARSTLSSVLACRPCNTPTTWTGDESCKSDSH